MLIRVEPGAASPLYDQIADSIRHEAASGRLRAGERLPSARELSESLDVNLHTVLKAYQLLRDEGLVELRRGRGAVVASHASSLAELRGEAEALAAHAHALGVGDETLAGMVRAAVRARRSDAPTSRHHQD